MSTLFDDVSTGTIFKHQEEQNN